MNNYFLLIPIAIVIIIIIAIIIYLVKKSKNNNEDTTSILDVNEVGVPSSADFSYGYEKEETVVMQPIKQDEEKVIDNEEKDTTKNIDTNNESEE